MQPFRLASDLHRVVLNLDYEETLHNIDESSAVPVGWGSVP